MVAEIKRALATQVESPQNMINEFHTTVMSTNAPEDINQFTDRLRTVEVYTQRISKTECIVDYSMVDKIKSKLKKERYDEWKSKGDLLDSAIESRLDSLEREIREKVENNNSSVKAEFEWGNEVYLQLEKKRLEIEAYSDLIIRNCAQYGVTSGDININNDTYGISEWSGIYDDSIAFLNKVSLTSNPVRKVRELIPGENGQAAITIVVAVGLIMPYVLDVLAVLAFVAIVMHEMSTKKTFQRYAILLGLLYNIKPLEMGYKREMDASELLDVDKLMDEDERVKTAIEEYENEIAAMDSVNIEEEIEKSLAELTTNLSTITEATEKSVSDFYESKKKYIDECMEKYKQLQELFEEAKKNVKFLGDDQSSSILYRTKYMLGLKDGVTPEYLDLGYKNIVIRPGRNPLVLKKFIQAILINVFCNTTPGNLGVTVFDPSNYGKDVMGMLTDQNEHLFRIETQDFLSAIKMFAAQAQRNMKSLRGRSIIDYNYECEQTGKTPIEYQVLLVLSQASSDSVEKNETLKEFMSYSAECGIIVIVVTELNFDNTHIFNRPFAGVKYPYEFNEVEFIIDFGNKFTERVEKAKPRGLSWPQYCERAFEGTGDEQFWKDNTDDSVWLEPGFADGDPNNPKHYTVGHQGDIHGVIAGGTGAGKSVYLNHLIMTATKRYSPVELRLWLVDFKGTEFSFYLGNEEYPAVLPHMDACLCTSDPDYSKTLFMGLDEYMQKRFKGIMNAGFKNVKEYNMAIRKGKLDAPIEPRIVMIVDEFQVIFQKADTRVIEAVNKAITSIAKLGRAAGVHLIFASQSLKGTISADTLAQFTLRMCLRCDLDVSQMVLGTPYAGNIRQRNGLIYVRSSDDPKLEAQTKFKTPYSPDEEIRAHIAKCAKMAKEKNMEFPPAIKYEETTRHSISELEQFYRVRMYKMSGNDGTLESGLFVMGNPMTYSTNLAPDNFTLVLKNGENIMSSFMNNKDLVNFFFTIKKNIDMWRKGASVIYNSQSEELAYLCKFDEIVPKQLQKLASHKYSMLEMLNTMNEVVNARKDMADRTIPVVFVLLGWSSAVGFGIDPDSRKLIPGLNTLLNTAGEFNVHFIFINSALNDISSSTIRACNYAICGRTDERSATKLTDSALPAKPMEAMEDGYAFVKTGGELSKFKLYQSELDRTIASNKLYIPRS